MLKFITLFLTLLSSSLLYAGYSEIVSSEKRKDIIVLLDNSASMQDQIQNVQAVLVTQLKSQNLENSRLGIIYSELPASPNVSSFVGTKTSGSESKVLKKFQADLNFLMTGSGNATEKFFEPILGTFSGKDKNFHRKGTELIIYIVTDEDQDQTSSNMKLFTFLSQLNQFKNYKDVTINLLTPFESCVNYGHLIPVEGGPLYEAVAITKGNVIDLCNGNK